MTRQECNEIWEVIFARHKALTKMKVARHEYLDANFVAERSCHCIIRVLKLYGYDISKTTVYGGINPETLNSAWKTRLMNFEKAPDGTVDDLLRYSPLSSKVEHTTDNREA